MNANLIKLAAAGVAALGITSRVDASVYYTIGGTQNMEAFNVTFNDPAINYNFNGSVYAGGIVISQNGGTGRPINDSVPLNYVTLCTDFKGSLYMGSTYEYATPPSAFAGQTGIDPVWSNPQLAIQNVAQLYYTYGHLNSGGLGGTVEQMAALQLAVWMALYDTTSSGTVDPGSSAEFQVTGGDGAAIQDALGWVAGLKGNYTQYGGQLLTPYPIDSAQGNPDGELPQELLLDPPPFSSVPEPATILGAMALVIPLGFGIYRGIRKSLPGAVAK